MARAPKGLPVPDRPGLDSEQRLLDRARLGSESALGALFTRYASWLRRWSRGRLPLWARDGLDQRRALFRLNQDGPPSEPPRLSDEGAPQLQQLIDAQTWARYLEGLERLTPRHRRLVVGRVECGYSYRQLALTEGLSTPDAARMAFRRALKRLSVVMPEG